MAKHEDFCGFEGDLAALFVSQTAYKVIPHHVGGLAKESAPLGKADDFDISAVAVYSAHRSSYRTNRSAKEIEVSTNSNLKRGSATTTTPDDDIRHLGKFIPIPLSNSDELHIYLNKQAPKNLYMRWPDPADPSGWHRESTRKPTFAEAKDAAIEAYWQWKSAPEAKREKTFRELAEAYIEEKGEDHEDTGRLNGTLLQTFGAFPVSKLIGDAGTAALKSWNEERLKLAREKNPKHDGREVFYRHVRCVRAVLKLAKVKKHDLPEMPRRATGRRAALRPSDGEYWLIRAHLRNRIGVYRRGSAQWHARVMLRVYVDLLSCFTGRTGTEMLSATFEGISTKTVGGKTWAAFEVDGKVGRAIRYAHVRSLRVVAAIKKVHPTGKGLIFVHKDGTPRTVMHDLFRTAMDELEAIRNEPGRFSARFVPKQDRPGGITLYSFRHGNITGLERKGRPRASIAKVFGTSLKQIEYQYGQMIDEDALRNL